jgi:hypothetical protein
MDGFEGIRIAGDLKGEKEIGVISEERREKKRERRSVRREGNEREKRECVLTDWKRR